MDLVHRFLFPATWWTWAAYWWLASNNVKTASRTEALTSRLMHIVPLLVAFLLLWLPSVWPLWLNARFIPWAEWEFWVGAALAASGLLFTVAARRHLGRNWSAVVTVKQDHELIASGPYSFVRHPIYSGLLLAFLGSALARGEWRGLLAFVIVFLALWRKLRLEERWMREQFGQNYVLYRQRVPALIPLLI